MAPRKDYATEAAKLARAIDIAIDSFKKYPPKDWEEKHILHFVQVYSEWKYDALHPTPEYRKLSSLKQKIHEAFTRFQEGTGEDVDYFWTQIAKENLDYVREDRLRKIIDRGSIKGRLEFDCVTDTFMAAKQEGRITEAEANQLSSMLGKFEKRKRN